MANELWNVNVGRSIKTESERDERIATFLHQKFRATVKKNNPDLMICLGQQERDNDTRCFPTIQGSFCTF